MEVPLHELARVQAQRFFIEHGFNHAWIIVFSQTQNRRTTTMADAIV